MLCIPRVLKMSALWVGVGIRLCLMAHDAFLDILLFEVLWWYVGCEPPGFDSSFCSVLVWFF